MNVPQHYSPAPHQAMPATPIGALAWSAEHDVSWVPAAPAPSTGNRVPWAAAALGMVSAGAALGVLLFGGAGSPASQPAAQAAPVLTPRTIQDVVPPADGARLSDIHAIPVVPVPSRVVLPPAEKAPGTIAGTDVREFAPSASAASGGGLTVIVGGDVDAKQSPPVPAAPPVLPPVPAQGLPTPTKPEVSGASPVYEIPGKQVTPTKPEVSGASPVYEIPGKQVTPTKPEVTGASPVYETPGLPVTLAPTAPSVFPGLATGLGISPPTP